MIVKAGLAVAVLVTAVTAAGSVNLRSIYNEMYPVDGLKRGAFGLCHESDPTFVRAAQSDRESCFERMPQPIALAIGWARHGSGLAGVPPANLGTMEAAELFLAQTAAALRYGDAEDGPPSGCNGATAIGAISANAILASAAPDPLARRGMRDAGARPELALLPQPAPGTRPPQPPPLLPSAAADITPSANPIAGSTPIFATGARIARLGTASPGKPRPDKLSLEPPLLQFSVLPAIDLGDRPVLPAARTGSALGCPPRA